MYLFEIFFRAFTFISSRDFSTLLQHIVPDTFNKCFRRLSSIGKMDVRIYRLLEDTPEDTGRSKILSRKAHGIFKVWPLRRGVCEFCVKYTMRTLERHIVPSDGPSVEYRSSNRRKNITTVLKVSTILTSA